jgi:hypothetical protein
LLNERNCVPTNLATEAHKTRGPVEHDEVRTPAICVKRTPAHECRASATKLDAVTLDDLGDGMLLTDALGINAFSGGSGNGHHDACRRVRNDQDSRVLLWVGLRWSELSGTNADNCAS